MQYMLWVYDTRCCFKKKQSPCNTSNYIFLATVTQLVHEVFKSCVRLRFGRNNPGRQCPGLKNSPQKYSFGMHTLAPVVLSLERHCTAINGG